MAPARGMSQRLAERLFISTQRVDFRTTMSKAANILVSVATLDDLLKRFATTIAEAVEADRVAPYTSGIVSIGVCASTVRQHPPGRFIISERSAR